MKTKMIFLFFAALSIFMVGCNDFNNFEKLNQETAIVKENIIGLTIDSERTTFGKQPGSNTLYTTRLNTAKVSANSLEGIANVWELKNEVAHSAYKWIIIFSTSNYTNHLNIPMEDVAGIGVCYLYEGAYEFELFENVDDALISIENFKFGNEFPTRIFDHVKQLVKQPELIKSLNFIYADRSNTAKLKSPKGLFQKFMREF